MSTRFVKERLLHQAQQIHQAKASRHLALNGWECFDRRQENRAISIAHTHRQRQRRRAFLSSGVSRELAAWSIGTPTWVLGRSLLHHNKIRLGRTPLRPRPPGSCCASRQLPAAPALHVLCKGPAASPSAALRPGLSSRRVLFLQGRRPRPRATHCCKSWPLIRGLGGGGGTMSSSSIIHPAPKLTSTSTPSMYMQIICFSFLSLCHTWSHQGIRALQLGLCCNDNVERYGRRFPRPRGQLLESSQNSRFPPAGRTTRSTK